MTPPGEAYVVEARQGVSALEAPLAELGRFLGAERVEPLPLRSS